MGMKHILTVRLDEKDMEKLRRDALATNRTISDHVRLLVRTPVELSEGDDAVLVFSLFELGKIERQLQRMGVNFNQAVRALNSLALWAKEGGDYFDNFTVAFNREVRSFAALQPALAEVMELFLRIEKRVWVQQSSRLRHKRMPIEHNISRVKNASLPRTNQAE